MFNSGDKIRKKDGSTWINDELIVTVDRVEEGYKIYAKETETWMHKDSIVLVESAPTTDVSTPLVEEAETISFEKIVANTLKKYS